MHTNKKDIIKLLFFILFTPIMLKVYSLQLLLIRYDVDESVFDYQDFLLSLFLLRHNNSAK